MKPNFTRAFSILALAASIAGCGKKDDAKPGDTTLPTSYNYGYLFVMGDTNNASPAQGISYSPDATSNGHFTATRASQGTNYADVAPLAAAVQDTTLTPFKGINPQNGILELYMPAAVSNVFTDMKDNHVTLTATSKPGAVSKDATIIHFQNNNRSVANTRKGLRDALAQTLINSSKKTDQTANGQPTVYNFNYQP